MNIQSLTGGHLINGIWVPTGVGTFRAKNPVTGQHLPEDFYLAGPSEFAAAVAAAEEAREILRDMPEKQLVGFLRAVANGISGALDIGIARGEMETPLNVIQPGRIGGEIKASAFQTGMLTDLLESGWAANARRTPGIATGELFRLTPEIRTIMLPCGIVLVVTVCNFPWRFGVIGGDVISALVARCPVIVKGHRSQPGINEIFAEVMRQAMAAHNMPAGIFQMLQGDRSIVNAGLANLSINGLGFTGSRRAAKDIMRLIWERPDAPSFKVAIEAGGVNHTFITNSALIERFGEIAKDVATSALQAAGFFCTQMGLLVVEAGDAAQRLIAHVVTQFEARGPQHCLADSTMRDYNQGCEAMTAIPGVQRRELKFSRSADPDRTEANPSVFVCDGDTFLGDHRVEEEVFGPSIMICVARRDQMVDIARKSGAALTSVYYGGSGDETLMRAVQSARLRSARRHIASDMPTGVRLCGPNQHGGPWPAGCGGTSVGEDSIRRWQDPTAFQTRADYTFPEGFLPERLAAMDSVTGI